MYRCRVIAWDNPARPKKVHLAGRSPPAFEGSKRGSESCRIQGQGVPALLRVARRKLSTIRGLRVRARARGLYVWYIRNMPLREI